MSLLLWLYQSSILLEFILDVVLWLTGIGSGCTFYMY